MNKYLLNTLYIFFAAAILTANPAKELFAAEPEVIRVGFFEFDGFHNISNDGELSGYGYDYLHEISKYTGWKYKYVYCNWSSCQEMLRNGEIDLLGSAQYTSERAKVFEFSKLDFGVSYVILTANSNNTSIALNDYASFNGLRIGLLENSSRNESLNELAEHYDFKFKPLYFKTQDDLKDALVNHHVDAILTSNLRKVTNERVIAKFAPSPFYFIARKGDKAITSKIDEAINYIKINNPYYDIELYHKHYPKVKEEQLVLSRKELEFAHKFGKVRVVYDARWKPIEYQDSKSDDMRGAVADIFDLIEKKTGLEFTFVPVKSIDDAVNYVKLGKADLIASIANNDIIFKDNDILLSLPYMKLQIVLIKNKDIIDIANARLAVRSDQYRTSVFLNSNKYNFKPIFFNTSEECIAAVNSGKADITYLNTFLTEYYMQNPTFRNMTLMTVNDLKYELSVAMSSEANRSLLTIINKAISNISDTEYNDIIFRNAVREKYKTTLISLIYSNPAEAVILVTFIFLLLFIFIVLRSSMVQAKIANRLKTIFIAKMSHEIRTPINAIMGFLRLLRDEKQSGTSLEYINIIERSGKTLLELVNSILDISKIESGKVKLDLSEFDISTDLDSISRLFVASSMENGINLVTFVDPEIPKTVIGDQQKIRQVLSNLLSNASKFTESGGYIYLDVSVVEKNDKAVKIRFSVRDTGIGIAKSDIPLIFNPFHQLKDNTISNARGTGLGLTISREFVHLMGGNIEIASVLGVGSEFFFTLVFKPVERSRPLRVAEGRIAYVELPKSVEFEFVERNFTSIGYNIEIIENLKELMVADLHQYNLLIIAVYDVSRELFNAVKELRKKNSSLPVMMISYPFESPLFSELEELNIIMKLRPIMPSVFSEIIFELLSKSETHEEKVEIKKALKFNAKVLVAEDDMINSQLIKIVLSKYGLDVQLVSDGKKAFEKYCEGFDMIFMDINMPVMDGLQSTALIRKDESLKDRTRVPIVAFTANIMKGDEESYIEVGIDDVLSKPFDIDVLEMLLNRYLGRYLVG